MLVAAIYSSLASFVLAGIVPEDPDEHGYWDEHSVICARVVAVPDAKSDDKVVTLEVLATIAGSVDAGREMKVRAHASVGFLSSMIPRYPTVDSTVVALLGKHGAQSEYFITNGSVPFFSPASNVAMFEIEGLSDPKIEIVRKAIEKLRKAEVVRSLVFATVLDLKETEGDVILQPQLRLAGPLDCTRHAKITVHFRRGDQDGAAALPIGQKVIALIEDRKSEFAIPTEPVVWLPPFGRKGRGLLPVSSFDSAEARQVVVGFHRELEILTETGFSLQRILAPDRR